MKKNFGLRAKTWTYLMDDDSEHKKAKWTKNSLIKRGLMFKNYTGCLLNGKTILKSQNHNEDLKVIFLMYILNKSIRLHQAVMMIGDYKHLIKLQRIHTEQTHLKYSKARC